MVYNEKYAQFLIDFGKASGEVAICEAVHAAYKACCEARTYHADYNYDFTPYGDQPIHVTRGKDMSRREFAKELADMKRITGRTPKLNDRFIEHAWKGDNSEGSIINHYNYTDEDTVVQNTGVHHATKNMMSPSTAKMAQRIAMEKYGIKLNIVDEIPLYNRGGYCYGVAPGLVGESITHDYADGPSNTGDYSALGAELARFGFGMETESYGDGEMSFEPSGTTYYFPYTKAIKYT